LTPAVLEQRPPTSGRVEIRDTLSPLILRITAAGRRHFIVRARIKGHRQPIRLYYPDPPHTSVLESARAWAVATVGSCRRGEDPRLLRANAERSEAAAAEVLERSRFGTIVTSFMAKHAAKNRSYAETKRILDFYVLPRWKDRPIQTINRAEVVALLDEIESGTFKAADGKFFGGPVMADHVLAQVRKLMNWYAARDADYSSPIVRGMARTKPKERARTRVLTDDEIRALWAALDVYAQSSDENNTEMSVFPDFVRALFLTAQRRDEVAAMGRTEIAAEGVWTVPADRSKNKRPNVVPLTSKATAIVASQVQVDDCDYVFTTNGETPFSGFSKAKRRLDKLMLAQLHHAAAERQDMAALTRLRELARLFDQTKSEHEKTREAARKLLGQKWWTLHDLRRTAKTLMSRAGVRPDISERVLGHVIAGVEGVYDQHAYIDEKRHALEALALLVDRIVNAGADNVVPLTYARASS